MTCVCVHAAERSWTHPEGRSITTDGDGNLHVFTVENPYAPDRTVTVEAAASEVAIYGPGQWRHAVVVRD